VSSQSTCALEVCAIIIGRRGSKILQNGLKLKFNLPAVSKLTVVEM